jgi:hypothetical protein
MHGVGGGDGRALGWVLTDGVEEPIGLGADMGTVSAGTEEKSPVWARRRMGATKGPGGSGGHR